MNTQSSNKKIFIHNAFLIGDLFLYYEMENKILKNDYIYMKD